MRKPGSRFFKTIPKLSRDPLGIIALFIALTYAIASLILGLGSHLTNTQKWPIIIFLVAFPVIVLIAFLWVVVNHNQKLYAPGDYRSDDSFLQTLEPGAQADEADDEPQAEARVSEPSRQKITEDQRTKARLAEDLVLRDLEREMKLPFRRQSGFRSSAVAPVIPFHGIATNPEQIMAVEVKYVSNQLNEEQSQAVQHVIEKLTLLDQSALGRPLKCIIAVITETNAQQQGRALIEQLNDLNSRFQFTLESRLYDFEDLCRTYRISSA